MLLFGLLDAANFTLYDSISSLTLGFIYIYFQPFTALIAILYAVLNIKSFRKEELETSPEIIEKHRTMLLQSEEESILKYKEKFQNLDNEELNQKIGDVRFTKEAKEAARRILEERNR